ncbi:hypothetical protein OC835_005332 [Tilletia horrida]|uniref:Polysaccharide lyase family 14 protein n=1 Tax=Tilletia horrida TaxID=155126 RepID=A0AAN6GLQ1_9BASI|nr:hypothetical protein OC835_005332 [Tilletia horrida]KAK0540393.1 hypothetical protein OC842_000507 [Tilletia horrida]KAK0567383.1 hypothetical protein OC844_000273 [Tilletia horrida]
MLALVLVLVLTLSLAPSAAASPVEPTPLPARLVLLARQPQQMGAASSSSSSSTAAPVVSALNASATVTTSTSEALLTANPSSSATTTAPPNSTLTDGGVNATSTSTLSSLLPLPTPSTPANATASPPTMPAGILYNYTSGQTKIDFLDPLQHDGFMTTILPMPNGQPNLPYGEPINAIISGRSSPSVVNVEGFLRWATSVNFGVSCLGQTNGSAQLANLGDGKGNVTQGNDGSGDNGVLRWNYGDPYLGTCKESVIGGNHFRWWPQAKTGAYFIAASVELSAKLGHMISLNGYNLGRDELVGNATNPNGTYWAGYRFNTTVEWIPAGVLLNATSEGINHPDVALPGQPSQDGRVALLTITQLASPDSSAPMAATLRNGLAFVLLPAFLVAATVMTL